MSKVRVYLRHQDPAAGPPPHRCSKTLAKTLSEFFPFLVAYDRAALVLHLKTGEAWSSVKARIRPKTSVVVVPLLNPPDYLLMAFQNYPEPGRESVRHPHDAFRMACLRTANLQGKLTCA